jgi:hypothetical protein
MSTISRRELYAHGEPLGDSVTRRKLGGGYVCGFGGSSSSRSSNTTQNFDQRTAVQDGIGISGSSGLDLSGKDASGGGVIGTGNSVTTSSVTNITDGGIVSRALDSVDVNNATAAAGFSELLGTAERLFSGAGQLVTGAQTATADAYRNAQTDTAGGVDQKTIIALAVAGVVAAVALGRK